MAANAVADRRTDPSAGTADQCGRHPVTPRSRPATWRGRQDWSTGSLAASRSSGASALVSVSRSWLTELGEQGRQGGDPVGQRLAVNSQPARGDVNEHRTQVRRVARTLHQADFLQPADRHRGGWCANPFVRGEVGHPDRTPIEQGDQNRQLGQRQLGASRRAAMVVAAAQNRRRVWTACGEDPQPVR